MKENIILEGDLYLPLISVIIPCYNQAHYLNDAVKSIVEQTYSNWEIIIINDGSPDNTSEVSNELIKLYRNKKIYLIEKNNGGLSDARNIGINQAKGEWILPLDSDDMFHKDFMEKAVEIINNDKTINFITTNLISFGQMTSYWRPTDYTPEKVITINTFIYASLYKKEFWQKAGGYNPIIPWGAEDWNFWICCSKIGINYKRIEENLFLYRTHQVSMVTVMLEHFEEVKAFIRTLHPDLYDKKLLHDSYEIIANMNQKTFEIIEKKVSLFPEYSILYFWLGLYYEQKDDLEKALENYLKSVKNITINDWQPFFKLSSIYKKLNMLEEAKTSFIEYKKRAKLQNSLLIK